MSAQLEGLARGYSLAYPRQEIEYCLREAERAEKVGNGKLAQWWLEAAVWAEGQL